MMMRQTSAALTLTLLFTAALATEEDTSDCIAGAIVQPVVPEALAEYRIEMAKADVAGRSAAFSSEDMVTAREGRQDVRTYFDPRQSIDKDGAEIELPARFCGMEYPECTGAFANG